MNSIPKLTTRMQCICDLVTGDTAADIGTDHGFVGAYLYATGKCKTVILTDVNDGPLKIADNNLCDLGIYAIELRKGDGLKPLGISEVDDVIIAGMGGELIEAILNDDMNKSKSFHRFILQPRTHSDDLRYFLSDNGFRIVKDKLVLENNKVWEIFVAEPCDFGKSIDDKDIIASALLDANDPLMIQFLDQKIHLNQTIIYSLKNSSSYDAKTMIEERMSIISSLENIKKRYEKD